MGGSVDDADAEGSEERLDVAAAAKERNCEYWPRSGARRERATSNPLIDGDGRLQRQREKNSNSNFWFEFKRRCQVRSLSVLRCIYV